MSDKGIEVPLDVLQAMEAVRSEGKFNMFSVNDVVTRMSQLGHHRAYLWLVDEERLTVDREKYLEALKELGRSRELLDRLSGE